MPPEPATPSEISRRRFLAATAAPVAALAVPRATADPPPRLRVAAIYTVFRRRSHAFDILENFLEPYLFNGERIDPGMDVVSFYADQTAVDGDLTRAVADRYRIRVCRTIAEAMQPGVDAVLSIGEHGEYSTNALGRSSIRASGSSMSA